MRRLPRSSIPLWLAGLALVAALAPASVTAAPAPTAIVNLGAGECGIQGEAGAITNDRLRLKVFSPAGKRLRSYTVDTSGDTFDVGCPGPALQPGQIVRFYNDSATKPFRSFTMPTLTLTLDRVHEQFRGTATGGVATVTLNPATCDADFGECVGLPTIEATVKAATHRYRVQHTDDITGLWFAWVRWVKGSDQVQRFVQAPHLVVTPGSAAVTGAGDIGTRATVSVRRGQQVGSGSGKAGFLGKFKATLKRNGAPMKVKAGDVVSSTIAADARMTVPPSSLTFTGTTIEGVCFKHGIVAVEVHAANDTFVDSDQTLADDAGAWSVPITLLAGAKVTAWCANGNGDAIFRSLVAL